MKVPATCFNMCSPSSVGGRAWKFDMSVLPSDTPAMKRKKSPHLPHRALTPSSAEGNATSALSLPSLQAHGSTTPSSLRVHNSSGGSLDGEDNFCDAENSGTVSSLADLWCHSVCREPQTTTWHFTCWVWCLLSTNKCVEHSLHSALGKKVVAARRGGC